jgi:hypothetical protein
MTADATSPAVTVRPARTAAERELAYRLRYHTYLTEIPAFSAVTDHTTRQLTGEHGKHQSC